MIATLSNLFESTANLYDRFGLKPSIENARNGIVEESLEVIAELEQYDPSHLAEEVVDLFVVAISALLSRGLDERDLNRAMQVVINKNNAKNSSTHIVHKSKITRIDKVANFHDTD